MIFTNDFAEFTKHYSINRKFCTIQYYRILLYFFVQFVQMTDNRRLLGSTKVCTCNIITVVKKAAEALGIDIGDHIAFYEENGIIYIENG